MSNAEEVSSLEADLMSAIETIDTSPAAPETTAPSPSAEGTTAQSPLTAGASDSAPEVPVQGGPEGVPPADSGAAVTDVFLSRLKERGVDVTGQYKSDDDILEAFINQRKLLGRRDETAQIGRALLENPQAFFAQYAPQYGFAPAQHGQQMAPQTTGVDAPLTVEQFEELNRAVIRDDAGKITGVHPGYDPQAAVRLREIEQRAIRTQQEFFLDPTGFLARQTAAQEAKIRELVAKELSQHSAVVEQQQEATAFMQQNRHWLMDEATQTLSPTGRQFYSYMQEGMQSGIPEQNTKGLVLYAIRSMQAASNGQPRNSTPPATTSPAAVSRPNVSALPPVKEEGEYNEGEDLEKALLRNLGFAPALS